MANLFIISAPSGCGKTSLIKSLLDDMDNLSVSVSHTTRKPRDLEVDGKDYNFISKQEFQDMVKKDEFIEYAEVFGNYYGTSKKTIDDNLLQNKDVILEIDWQGARQVRKNTKAKSIFILPPSKESLLQRLTARNQDSKNVIAQRMADVKNEISHFNEFDFIVFNDNFANAVKDIKNIIISTRLSLAEQEYKNKELIKKLFT